MSYFEIVAGTYEEFLLGYKFNLNDSKLVQSFASHDHSSSIRAVATSGHYLASGGADDRIIIYDLERRKEHCMLTHHDSTINCLQFTKKHSHLISGSADGVLAINRVGNWQLEKLWDKAHNGMAILDIAVHSSGKLALTLGSDCSLRTWNLVKGRQAFIVNLNSKSKDAKSLENILWAEDFVRFILYGGHYTEIWSIETGGILKSIEHNTKVSSCIWLSSNTILVGHEDGHLTTVNVDNSTKIDCNAHSTRIKAIAKYENYIVTASSDGEIKVWNETLKELANSNSGCRITCLSILPLVCLKKEEEQVVQTEEARVEIQKKTIEKRNVVVEVEMSDNENKSSVKELKLDKKKRKKKLRQEQSENDLAVVKTKKKFKEIKSPQTKRKRHKKIKSSC